MKHMVYKTCWAIIFTLNLIAVILSFTSRWEGGYEVSKSFLLVTLVILWLSAMAANIVVTDIAAEYICILLGAAKLHGFDESKEMKTGLLEAPECRCTQRMELCAGTFAGTGQYCTSTGSTSILSC